MEFRIDPKVAQAFPSLCIGAVVAKGSRAAELPEIDQLLSEQEDQVRERFDPETFTQDPRLQAWREAYRLFGVKPRDGKSSIENLIRIVLSGRPLKRVNALVDLYNLISLKHTIPVGGEDIDRIEGALWLRHAQSAEKPTLLIGDTTPETPPPGEVFYCDDLGAVCRKWNWREGDRTKLTEQTRNAIFVLDGIAPLTHQEVKQATLQLAQMLEHHCAAKCSSQILTPDNLVAQFD